MTRKRNKGFRRFNTVIWSIIAVLVIYIAENKHVTFATGQEKKECISVNEGHELMANYFSMNYITSNDDMVTQMAAYESENDENKKEVKAVTVSNVNAKNEKISKLLKEKDFDYLRNNFYIIDSSTSVTKSLLDPEKLLSKDMSIKKNKSKPQILIYHTHSHEKYSDSVDNVEGDTVVGVGDYLTELLEKEGYNVIHDKTSYDVVDGKWNRNSYETALTSLEKIISENPSIMVTIDVHRNSGNEKEVTSIDGKDTAQIMFFNGVSRTRTGTRSYLYNKNLSKNLAFSLQMQLLTLEQYPDLSKCIYIKGYRYNLHIAGRSMLVEVGNDKNTVQEAKNAMEPFSKVLIQILEGAKVSH